MLNNNNNNNNNNNLIHAANVLLVIGSLCSKSGDNGFTFTQKLQ